MTASKATGIQQDESNHAYLTKLKPPQLFHNMRAITTIYHDGSQHSYLAIYKPPQLFNNMRATTAI
jgi:hypothetical protein